MSLLATLIVKNSYILAAIYNIFLKKCPRPKLKGFKYSLKTHWKDQKSSNKVRPVLAHFCKLVSLILDFDSVKDVRVTKIVKQMNFKETWGKLKKIHFEETIIDKMFEKYSSFHTK